MLALQWVFIVFTVLIGGGTTLAIVILFFVTLIQKIYRKIKYGASLYD